MLKEHIYSLWTDNVDFVHICYIQCDLFSCYIFNWEILPATLANTFLFILQGSALADLRYRGRFYGTLLGTDRISAMAMVSTLKLLKMSFGPGFGHESFGQATATAETGDWCRQRPNVYNDL